MARPHPVEQYAAKTFFANDSSVGSCAIYVANDIRFSLQMLSLLHFLQAKTHHGGQDLPMGTLTYTPPTSMRKLLTSVKLFLAPPWRKFKKGSVLVIEVMVCWFS